MTTELQNTLTLKQGINFKKYQNKIIKTAEKKNKEAFQNIKEDTQKLLDLNPAIQQNAISEFQDLQTRYNSLLERYQTAQTQLMSKTTNYIGTGTGTGTNTNGKNVIVDRIVDNPSSTYVGLCNDNPDLTIISGIDYNQCQQEAINKGNKYFGLENNSSGVAQCSISNDMEQLSKYGEAVSKCTTGVDGKIYGGSWLNALFNTQSGEYYGCYKDKDAENRAMSWAGPDLSTYSNVYVLGLYGMAPWGTSKFTDLTASWIWYTSGAQNDAPVNIGAPITLIYNYYYTGDSYINATISCGCDDSATIYLNAQQIGTINGWGNTQISITLAPGNNYISAGVINTGGPAGFILFCSDSANTVLFNTNSEWKYTTIPAQQLVPNGRNYTYDTCKQYAANGKYQYFGLQDGTTGTSACMVSNDFQKSTKYGLDIQSTTESDGKVYGTDKINAVYNVGILGNPENMGKIGYINTDGTVSEYPSSMVKDGNIINPNKSCSTDTSGIDSVQWQNYTKSADMNESTECGLALEIQGDSATMEELETELEDISLQLINKINSLEQLDSNIMQQLGINETTLSSMLDEYTIVNKKFMQYKKSHVNNINSIVSDSDIVVTSENYSYILWFVLAILFIIVAFFLVTKMGKQAT